MTDMSYAAGMLVAGLWCVATHYLPWRHVLGGQPIWRYPMVSYLIGVLGIFIGFVVFVSVATLTIAREHAVAGLMCVMFSAGVATILTHAGDMWIERRNEAKGVEIQEEHGERTTERF